MNLVNRILALIGICVIIGEVIDAYENHCNPSKCINGTCQNGKCECQSCFTGVNCDQKKINERPAFEQHTYHVSIIQRPLKSSVLTTVKALDNDHCATEEDSCPCGLVEYSILVNTDTNLFAIDAKTGEIRLASDRDLPVNGGEYSLVIKASNKAPFNTKNDNYDTASVVLMFNMNGGTLSGDLIDEASDSVLGRQKRATAPTKTAFTLTQIEPSTNVTSIKVGQPLKFEVVITFKSGDNGAVTLELYSPVSSDKEVMIICDVKITHNGTDLTVPTLPAPVKEGKTPATKWPYTRIVYKLNSIVNNNGAPVNIANIQMKIQFDVVMSYFASMPSATYYVSAGAEYLAGAEIWVGQSGYPFSTTPPEPTPNITLTGDTNIYPDSTAVFDLTIEAIGAYQGFNIEFYAPLNDSTVLNFCLVKRYVTGSGYDCIPSTLVPTLISKTVNNKEYFYKAVQSEIGFVPNKASIAATPSKVDSTVKYKLALRTNPKAWIGSTYYIGVSMEHVYTKVFTTKLNLPVITKPAKPDHTTQLPFVVDYVDGNTAKIGAVKKVLLKVTIPKDKEIDLTITGISKFKKMEVCGLKLKKSGKNIPCFDKIEPIITNTIEDEVMISRSFLYKNVRNINLETAGVEDEIELFLFIRPINDTARTSVGDTATVQVNLVWNGGQSTVAEKSFTLQAPETIPPAPSDKLPAFTFNLNGHDGNMSVNLGYTVKLVIQLKPGQLYGPAVLELFTPVSGTTTFTTQVKICSVSMIRVGKNVICVVKEILNKKFNITNRGANPELKDKATLNMGTLMTIGNLGDTPTNEDEIEFIMKVIPKVTSATVININAGLVITSTQIWVGSIPIKIATLSSTYPAIDTVALRPSLFASRADGSSNMVVKNDILIMRYHVKVRPDKLTKLDFKLFVDPPTVNPLYGICNFKFVTIGSGISCMEKTVSETKWPTDLKTTKEYNVNFDPIYVVTESNFSDTSMLDETSIYMEAVVKTGDITSDLVLKGELTYNNNKKITDVQTFTYSTSPTRQNSTLAGMQPVFNMSFYALFNDTDITVSRLAYGEAGRVVIVAQMKPNSYQSLKFVFSSKPSTMEQMELVSANLIKAGRNILCKTMGFGQFKTESRTGSTSKDMVSLDLGTIIHRNIYTTNVTDEDSKIYVEGYFVVRKSPKDNPTELEVNGVALLNNDEIHITKLTFATSSDSSHIVDYNGTSLTPNISATAEPSTVQTGDDFELAVNVTIPYWSQYKSVILFVYPTRDGDSSYVVQAANATPTSDNAFGQHIGLNSKDGSATMQSLSSSGSSQLDFIKLDMGIMQNLGWRYKLDQLNYTDGKEYDAFTVRVKCRLSDHPKAVDLMKVSLTIGVQMGSVVVNSTGVEFTVSRIAAPGPLTIETNTTLLSSASEYAAGVPIEIETNAKLANTSKMECRNFNVIAAVPNYIILQSVSLINYTSSAIAPVTNKTTKNVAFEVPYFFYKENLNLKFALTLKAGITLPKKRQTAVATIPIIYTCKKASEPTWVNKVDPIVVTLRGATVVVSIDPSCNTDLGMKNSAVIKDCAIRSTATSFPGFDVLKIRSNSGAYWKPPLGISNHLRYVDIIFGKYQRVTSMNLVCPTSNKPTKIQIHSTVDGRSFDFYKEVAISWSGNNAGINLENPKFMARGLKIVIISTTDDNKETGLNVDLVGCASSFTDSSIFDPCTVYSNIRPKTPLPHYFERGFLYIAPHIFVCHETPINALSSLTQPRCFRSQTSTPTVWQDLGPKVGKIIGYDSTKNHLYGLSANLQSYVMSEDDGQTWLGYNQKGFEMTKALRSLASPVEVPWNQESGFRPSDTAAACNKYSAGTWQICYDGIYNSGTKHLSWNKCC